MVSPKHTKEEKEEFFYPNQKVSDKTQHSRETNAETRILIIK
jgi:hypothetical protein